MKTRGDALGINIVVGNASSLAIDASSDFCGVMVQYPDTRGVATDLSGLVNKLHGAGALVVACTDLMASTLLKPVGEMGVDIAVGSAQRFGVPMVCLMDFHYQHLCVLFV